MFVFVYGTLKQGHGNARLMDGAIVSVEPAVVTGYTLFETGIPYAAPARGFRIVGELVEIDGAKAPDVLKRLDQLEGHPRHYVRTPVEAVRQSDKTPFAAFMYVVAGEPHGNHLGESWPPEAPAEEPKTLSEQFEEAARGRGEPRPRFSWACVATTDGKPGDVSDVWVVKVEEAPGYRGPVTWLHPTGRVFEQVLAPVRKYRSEARADRKKFLKSNKLSNSQREFSYD